MAVTRNSHLKIGFFHATCSPFLHGPVALPEPHQALRDHKRLTPASEGTTRPDDEGSSACRGLAKGGIVRFSHSSLTLPEGSGSVDGVEIPRGDHLVVAGHDGSGRVVV